MGFTNSAKWMARITIVLSIIFIAGPFLGGFLYGERPESEVNKIMAVLLDSFNTGILMLFAGLALGVLTDISYSIRDTEDA